MNPILKTNKLAIGYQNSRGSKHKTLASDLNLTAAPGELVCLLGKNGVGKSTLLRTIAGMQPKISGEIVIDNQPIEKLSNTVLAKQVALVLTEKIPENNLNVFDLVALGRQPYTNWLGKLKDSDTNMVWQSMEQVNIQDLAAKKYHELSDGQRQKVMIARALTQDTPLIILDEPTAHLDVHHTGVIFELLVSLAKNHHRTIIIATHEVNVALKRADVLWLMKTTTFVAGRTVDFLQSNALSCLFPTDQVRFDKESVQFVVN